jgi:hypothetical protein
MAAGKDAFMKITPCLLPVLISPGGRERSIAAGKSVLVLGVDGMGPNFLERHWDVLPNLDGLRREGEFKRLKASMPPRSPVRWSTFITGSIRAATVSWIVHRDPKSMMPVFAMSMAAQGSRPISLGSYELPLPRG